MKKIEILGDNLLLSILKQANFIELKDNKINIRLFSNSSFLKSKIEESFGLLQPIILEFYPNFVGFEFLEAKATVVPKSQESMPVSHKKVEFNAADKDKWPKANLLLSHFSGKIESK